MGYQNMVGLLVLLLGLGQVRVSKELLDHQEWSMLEETEVIIL